jgi:hypothetical protein
MKGKLMEKEETRAKEISDAAGTVTRNPALLVRFIGSLTGTILFFWGLYRLSKGDPMGLVFLAIGAVLLLKFGMVGILDLGKSKKEKNQKPKGEQ